MIYRVVAYLDDPQDPERQESFELERKSMIWSDANAECVARFEGVRSVFFQEVRASHATTICNV